ncbi:conserved hypothetical protein [Rippkaea orientalis PCC 8801]|uniref:Cyanoexosortase A system-associated protein n=1 Tax=Rippkaea orientalis (strain PCC 8801 / RF-1) TaxID=41431 RepID=B7K0A7_RIPO1|nr:cyanoexosortase A system-associated protein [Rippkaea orientalis]ACK67391.1 conserved hypothetical protein [Rippkaea orientalis PCC 8801]
MVKTSWESARIGLFAILLTGIIATIIRAFLVSPDSKPPITPVTFPDAVPLEGWQPLAKTSPTPKGDKQLYHYTNNGKTLEILASDRLYDGANVSRLLFKEASMPPATISISVKQKEGIGNYWMFEYENKAYLTACINRVGESTVNEQQHTQNKYKYGWSVGRTLLWVVGYKNLLETSCLWTLISIPITSDLTSSDLEKTHQTLETVWIEWYDWWKPRLEKLH